MADEYPEEFDRLLDEAAERMEERDFAGAVEPLQEAARLVPDDPEVWQRLAESRFGLGEVDAAESAYRRWWDLAPGNPLAFRAYANLLFRLGRYDEAEAGALVWIAREQNDPYALILLANARYKLGEEFESWLDRAAEIDPDLFARMMTGVFDYSREAGPGEWGSLDAAEYLGLPEIRLIEAAARGALPGRYDPETETFTFKKSDLDSRRAILNRFQLEEPPVVEPAVTEIDFAADIDDLEVGQEVRVLLQKCPHCGEWTAGPLGDRERYFCCGAPMDPFIELSSEIEIRGEVIRSAGGGRVLSERIRRLSRTQQAELRQLWLNGETWLPMAEEMLSAAGEDEGA